MNNEEKAAMFFDEAAEKLIANGMSDIASYSHAAIAQEYAFQMAQWKDEQYKTVYVVTRSEEHCDYVEKVFFDKNKAEEYCKSFNEDENSYHRDITKIEVSL